MGFDATEFLAGLFGGVSVSGDGSLAGDDLDAGGFLDCMAEPPGSVAVMACCDVDDQTNEWHWQHIDDADRQHLLGPVMSERPTEHELRRYACWAQQRHPEPCPWCGGRQQHHPLCCLLTWESEMPFGKFRGKPVTEVPEDYLLWLLRSGAELKEELRAAVERRLGYARRVGGIEVDG